MKNAITLAVATRQRTKELSRCLKSISQLLEQPQAVLIVDNDNEESAKKVFLEWHKKLPLFYVCEKKSGVPFARNTAIKNCKTKYLGFVDDDCILDRNWLTAANHAIKASRSAYVLGQTKLANENNVLALAQFYRDTYWFGHALKRRNKQTHPFNVDTKNILLDVRILKKEKISFDTKVCIKGYDSSDTDLGFQMDQKKLYGSYEAKMIIYHEERNTLEKFAKRAYFRGRIAYFLTLKWHLKREFVNISEKWFFIWLLRIFRWPREYQGYMKDAKQSLQKKLLLFLLIKLYDRVYLEGFINAQNAHKNHQENLP